MKHIKLLIFMLVGLQSIMYAAQETKQEEKQERQAIIDHVMAKYTGLRDGFDFLQENGLGNQSFHQFLEDTIPPLEDFEEDTELDFNEIIQQAEDRIAINMKDKFIFTLEIAMNEGRTLDQFDDPIFSYVMDHKDDYMQGMVRLWLFEWSKSQDGGKSKKTPLHWAVYRNLIDVVQLLITAGAAINSKDINGLTPLHRAAENNSIGVARLLISVGADQNIKDNYGWTPLYSGAYYNRIGVAQLLISEGANINSQNNEGKTALHGAAENNSIGVARLLINAGADHNIQDNYDSTPLNLASENNNTDLARLLIDAGATIIKDSVNL